jgi:hypothetical protein
MTRPARVQPTGLCVDLADLSHALGTDETRPHLCTPFGGACPDGVGGYLGATDGHRMALVRSEHWQKHERADAPPYQYVVPWNAPKVGELSALALAEEPRFFPKSWNVCLSFGRADAAARLDVMVKRGSGRKERKIYPLGRELVIDWGEGSKLEDLRHDLAITLSYLLDAVDFCGSGSVRVFNAGSTDPIVFAPYGAKTLADAERLAIVMPVRQ